MEGVPLYSGHLLTVDQLTQVEVDADIQVAVTQFLKGLTTQMFARIVRNGSAEVSLPIAPGGTDNTGRLVAPFLE